MLTGIILFVLSVLFFVFFIFYKRDMLVKMFSLDASVPAGQLQDQLEQTADRVIQRLETQIDHLELLLEEADDKIATLDQKLRAADCVLAELEAPVTLTPLKSNVVDLRLEAEPPAYVNTIVTSQPVPITESATPKDNKDNLSSDKRRHIMAMAGQGYSVTEIAKITGLGKGEIMLLLQLNRK
jgi:hypothetical protein